MGKQKKAVKTAKKTQKASNGLFASAQKFLSLFKKKSEKKDANGKPKYPALQGMGALPFMRDFNKMKNWWCAAGKGHEATKVCTDSAKIGSFMAGAEADAMRKGYCEEQDPTKA